MTIKKKKVVSIPKTKPMKKEDFLHEIAEGIWALVHFASLSLEKKQNKKTGKKTNENF